MSVYKAISAVSLALSKAGIGKDRKNVQQGYSFRGIDDVYNALAPLLAANGLCILPRVLSRECVERTTAKGNAIFYTTVHVEFDLVSAEDNSKHTVAMFGEAMDTADKSTNKAMSAAYKYMAMEVFAIPTEGDNDADATTHEVVAKKASISSNDVGREFWDNADIAEREFLNEELSVIRDYLAANDAVNASHRFYHIASIDEQAAVWSQLDSKQRATIKSLKKAA